MSARGALVFAEFPFGRLFGVGPQGAQVGFDDPGVCLRRSRESGSHSFDKLLFAA